MNTIRIIFHIDYKTIVSKYGDPEFFQLLSISENMFCCWKIKENIEIISNTTIDLMKTNTDNIFIFTLIALPFINKSCVQTESIQKLRINYIKPLYENKKPSEILNFLVLNYENN